MKWLNPCRFRKMNSASHQARSTCLEIAPKTASALPASVNKPRKHACLQQRRSPHCFKLKWHRNNPAQKWPGLFCYQFPPCVPKRWHLCPVCSTRPRSWARPAAGPQPRASFYPQLATSIPSGLLMFHPKSSRFPFC